MAVNAVLRMTGREPVSKVEEAAVLLAAEFAAAGLEFDGLTYSPTGSCGQCAEELSRKESNNG